MDNKIKSGDIVFYFNNEIHHFPKSLKIEDIGKKITELLYGYDNISLVDFGGVAEHFLGGRGDNPYIEDPPKIKNGTNIIFSFLPSNDKFNQCSIMNETSIKSGFVGMLITTKKEGKRGKADILNNIDIKCNYYEDTANILNSLTGNINKFWVKPSINSENRNCFINDGIEILEIEDFLNVILQ